MFLARIPGHMFSVPEDQLRMQPSSALFGAMVADASHSLEEHPVSGSHRPTMWGPLVFSWFITPVTIVIRTINHSYCSYKPT